MEAIDQFFADRKAAWLKAKSKSDLTDDEKKALEQKASERFAFASWLPDAAKRASQLSIVSHPSKFSHPSAKTTPLIATAKARVDGYLRTGNLNYEFDVFGNAAAMDVYKFLSLPMSDGRMILEHLEADTPEIQSLMDIPSQSYAILKNGFLAVKQANANKTYTDRLVKQVYFPIADNQYHLLSVLTPSGAITKLKKMIDDMRFSEQTSKARESRRSGKSHETGFDDILDLTVTAYGGTQPQNVSILNSQNAGRAYLLASVPPVMISRKVRLPITDFFTQSLRPWLFDDSFHHLHRLMQTEINNIKIRASITNIISYITGLVITEVVAIRKAKFGWSETEHYQALPQHQRIWLDDQHLDKRMNEQVWLDEIARELSQWFINAYKKSLQTEAIQLSDYEQLYVKEFVIEALNQDEELLK